MFYILLALSPTLFMIIAGYLFYYRQSIVRYAKLDNQRFILLLSFMYIILAFLGFVLILFTNMLYSLIWLVAVLIITIILIIIFKKLSKMNE